METIEYVDCSDQVYTFFVRNNRVYTHDGMIVSIVGFANVDGKHINYGDNLPSGTPDEQTRMRNWLMYDPVLIRCVIQYYSECWDDSVFEDKMRRLILNTVDYEFYFEHDGCFLIAIDGCNCIL